MSAVDGLKARFLELSAPDADGVYRDGAGKRRTRTALAMDRLRALWDEACAATSFVVPDRGVGLAATGSLSRGRIGPCSDLDLVLIHDGHVLDEHQITELANLLWYPLWDSGLDLDHAVRSRAQCEAVTDHDLPAATGWLEVRPVAGDAELIEDTASSILELWRRAARRRLPELLDSAQARLLESGRLPYLNQPNVKEAHGGLRDTVLVSALAASWLADRPHGGYDDAVERLLDVRDCIHLAAGRDTNLLLTAYQPAVAAMLGLADPTLPEGEPVIFHHAVSAEKEAVWIADRIDELVQQGVPYRDIAILYRAHYVTRTLEEVFLKRELPYTIYSGAQFFDRREIKDALSYLRMVAYKDDLSFQRIANVPKRNLGEKRMRFLKNYAEQNGCLLYEALLHNMEDTLFNTAPVKKFIRLIEAFSADYAGKPVSEVLSALLNQSGYEEMLRTEGSQERLDNLAELKQSVYEYEVSCGEECTLEDYLSHVALFSNSDTAERRNAVKLMTVHTAKGLEFPYVFLCALCEGVFPSTKTKTMPAMEEERRLAFVAMTRAEKALYLSDNEGRNVDGSSRVPSRFIFDIDRPLLQYTAELRESLVKEAKDHIRFTERQLSAAAQGPSFSVGDRVAHAIFGKGTIREIDPDAAVYKIQFDEIATPRTISFRVPVRRV